MGHGSWVMWVIGHFIDGTDGSWVTKCDLCVGTGFGN